MHDFLIRHHDELLRRCEDKAAAWPRPAATAGQLKNGVPHFLDELIRTLDTDQPADRIQGLEIACGPASYAQAPLEAGVSARAHASQLLDLGYTADQVVHQYCDLCQAIGELAPHPDAPAAVQDRTTLHRCLDKAIADAVTAFSAEQGARASRRGSAEANKRLGFFVHELRNSLGTATLAYTALQSGQLPIAGATGAVLGRSLVSLTSLVNGSLDEVRTTAGTLSGRELFSLSSFIADAGNAAQLDATARGCSLVVSGAEWPIEIEGDRAQLLGALMNLLQNAFKFTHPGTEVSLSAHIGDDGAAYIEVEDHCGGIAPAAAEMMFRPFVQRHADRSGLGLGLSICRANVEASGGSLSVRNLPGQGCVFTMRLVRHG